MTGIPKDPRWIGFHEIATRAAAPDATPEEIQKFQTVATPTEFLELLKIISQKEASEDNPFQAFVDRISAIESKIGTIQSFDPRNVPDPYYPYGPR